MEVMTLFVFKVTHNYVWFCSWFSIKL